MLFFNFYLTQFKKIQPLSLSSTLLEFSVAGTSHPILKIWDMMVISDYLHYKTCCFLAYMITQLDTRQPSKVLQVVERLANVPVVPPLETLKHIGMLLVHDEQMNKKTIGMSLLSFVHKLPRTLPRTISWTSTVRPVVFVFMFVGSRRRGSTSWCHKSFGYYQCKKVFIH